ncbi:hypothetical protein T492DRAFT_1131469 [Pavlovales sp. CCMP2436]|nr:hypothetical protein T492DRAFT_1131469 [Pavlovales sp. CCMP2436]
MRTDNPLLRAAWGMQTPIVDHSPMRIPGRQLPAGSASPTARVQLQAPRPRTSAAGGGSALRRDASPRRAGARGNESASLGNPMASFTRQKEIDEIMERADAAVNAFNAEDVQPVDEQGAPISWEAAMLELRDAIEGHLRGAGDTNARFEKLLSKVAKSLTADGMKGEDIPDGPSTDASVLNEAEEGLARIEKTARSRGKLQLIHEREAELFARVAEKANALYQQVESYSSELELGREAEEELKRRAGEAIDSARDLASQLALQEADTMRARAELHALRLEINSSLGGVNPELEKMRLQLAAFQEALSEQAEQVPLK